MTTNAAPPPWPTRVGKPQILPRPIAEPAAAMMKASLDPQVPLVSVSAINLLPPCPPN